MCIYINLSGLKMIVKITQQVTSRRLSDTEECKSDLKERVGEITQL